MLILAGVSINAIVGDNGIITQVMKAKELNQKASELEDLQMALVGYSLEDYANQAEALDSIINGLLAKEYIDWVDGTKDSSGNYIDYNQYEDENEKLYLWVKKGENSYKIFLDDDNEYSVDEMKLVGGGTLKGGTYVVTSDAFVSGEGLSANDKGKFTIEGNTRVVFKESLGVGNDGKTPSGEKLSISIVQGTNAKIYFNYDENTKSDDGKTYYYLTNEGLSRSAIDVAKGSTLDLYVDENVVVTVDSGFAENGVTATALGAQGGKGGFAGIHVVWKDDNGDGVRDSEEYSILNLSGTGELIAYGGNAGAGGGAVSGNKGGGRRWWSWPVEVDGIAIMEVALLLEMLNNQYIVKEKMVLAH